MRQQTMRIAILALAAALGGGRSALFGATVPVLPADLGSLTRTGGVAYAKSFSADNRALTVAFEIRPDRLAKGAKLEGDQGLVFANGNGWDGGFRLTLEPEWTGSYRAGFRICGARKGEASWVGYASGIPAEEWTALAVTWDGEKLRMYKDGVCCAVSPFKGPLGPCGAFSVGRAGYGVGFVPFDLRGFLVSGTALDERAVCARATGGASTPEEKSDYFLKGPDSFFVRFRPLAWQTAAQMAEKGDRATAARLYARLATVPAPGDDGCPTARLLAGRLGAPVEFFVAPDGSDEAAGTKAAPFATPVRARNEIRRLRAAGRLGGGATVYLRGGRYFMTASLELAKEDSGLADAPIVWCAYGDERPVLDGGRRIGNLKPCGRGEIRAIDLPEGADGFRNGRGWGYSKGSYAMPALYSDKGETRLAREPNEGFWEVKDFDRTNGWVKADVPDLASWADEKNLLALGYWRWLWADATLPVAIDAAAGTIAVKDGMRAHLAKKTPVCFLNALKAIDRPGEWCFDAAARRLYVWPRAGETLTLSQLGAPLLKAVSVRHVVIEGLVFEHGRAEGVRFDNCSDIVFRGNVIRKCDAGGRISGCRMRFEGNVLHTFSAGAFSVYGGDRRTLESSQIEIVNNEIFDIERFVRTYAPAVHAEGVGTVIARNHFHDCPSSAMRLEGNDFLLGSNLVERCVTESDDQGAVDIYANPTYAGIRIVGNIWRDCGVGENPFAPCGQGAVRFDDIISAMTVRGNRFYRCGRAHFGAVQINGGRLNVIDNNLFVDCTRDVSSSARTPAWWKETMTKGYAKPHIDAVGISRPPYSTRYPYMKNILSWPIANFISRNAYVNVPKATKLDGVNGCRVFASEPSALPEGFDPLPDPSEIGPARTPAFVRARANDAR